MREGLNFDDLTYGNIREKFKDGLFDSPVREAAEETLNDEATNLHLAGDFEGEVDVKVFLRGALIAKDPNLLPLAPTPDDTTSNVGGEIGQQASQASGPDANNEALTRRVGQQDGSQDRRPSSSSFLSKADRFRTAKEDEALVREKGGSLRSITKDGLRILATCAVAAAAQGMAQESIVGANLRWPADLGLATLEDGTNKLRWREDRNGLEIFSLVNAITYLAASIIGAWISDPLTYIFGRRAALLFAGACTFSAPIGAAYCSGPYGLMGCRLIQGVGIGSKSSVIPIIIAESFAKELRTRLLVCWQAFVAFGIMLGAITNIIFHDFWRLQIGICFSSAIPLLILCYDIPESPRWLIKKDRIREAFEGLRVLRETPLQAARDLLLIHGQVRLERTLFNSTTARSKPKDNKKKAGKRRSSVTGEVAGKRLSELRKFFVRVPRLVSIRRNWRAVVASCVVMFAQQCSGINLFAFLATTIIKQSGIKDPTNIKTLAFNVGFGAANTIASMATFWFLECRGRRKDKLGRRSLLLTSQILMIPLLVLTGYKMEGTWVDSKRQTDLASVVPLVIVYTIVYSPGAGVIPFMYASEIFPQDFREVGMSLACSVNFMCAFILAITVPKFTEPTNGIVDVPKGRYMKLFGAFAGLDALATILAWLFMRTPEPRASLEDMNVLFEATSWEYIQYEFTAASPRVISRVLPYINPDDATFAKWLEDRPKRVENGTTTGNEAGGDLEMQELQVP